MVKPTVEKMVNKQRRHAGKNGRAEEIIAKGTNDAVRLIMREISRLV